MNQYLSLRNTVNKDFYELVLKLITLFIHFGLRIYFVYKMVSTFKQCRTNFMSNISNIAKIKIALGK